MTPAAKISSDTWRRLARAHHLGARLGEETLTDLLVLEMLHFQRSNAFSVCHPTKRQESRWGADLLVLIRRRDGRIRRLAIQAKKLYPDCHYKALNHHVRPGIRQIDQLAAFAHQYRAIPLYLLYNHFDCDNPNNYWHCCKSLDIEQLGCTLVPSWRIDRALSQRGQRTFPAIHATGPSRPWRCVFDCDHPEIQMASLAMESTRELPTQVVGSYEARADTPSPLPEPLDIALPEFLFETTEPLSPASLDVLRTEIDKKSETIESTTLRSKYEPLYPRKLLIVDYVDSVDEA